MLRAVEFEEREGYVSFEGSKVKATEFVEPAIDLYLVDQINDPYFDSENTVIHMYNNSYVGSDPSTHAITITRIPAPDDYPLKNQHSNVYKIHFDTTKKSSPGLGGFYVIYYPMKQDTFEEAVYFKAPLGVDLLAYSNYDASCSYINARSTGAWQESHARIQVLDREETSGGHIAFIPNGIIDLADQFDIYIGAVAILDIGSNPDFIYTPLFDPSLGARITPGGVLSSDQFVEDSALSSVQVLRGGGSQH